MANKKKSPSVRLYTDPRAWDLPSVGGGSLGAHALFRFLGMQYAPTGGVSTSMTADDVLPVAVFNAGEDEKVVAGLTDIVDSMENDSSLPNPHRTMTKFMKSEARAYMTLVERDIEPARLYECWIDDANYDDFVAALRKSPDNNAAFPMNRLQMYLTRRRYIGLFGKESRQKIYERTEKALSALSTRLGEGKRYFYGDKPTALDAVVFGQLAASLYAPLPCAKFRSLIASQPNLVKFCEGIQSEYFSEDDDYDFQLDLEEIDKERRRISEQEAKTAAVNAAKTSKKDPENAEEAERKKNNKYFLCACAAVFGAFVLLGGETEFEAPSLED